MIFNMRDNATIQFVVSQAAYVESQVYQKKFPAIQYSTLIPVDTSANPWASAVTYMSSETVGEADFIASGGDDIPLVDFAMSQHETGVSMAAIGYHWTLEDVNKAMLYGVNLGAEKAFAARRAYEQFLDSTLLLGTTPSGKPIPYAGSGLIGHPDVPTSTAPAGVSTLTQWANKTPDEILADVNFLLSDAWNQTKMIEHADTLLLPVSSMTDIANRRLEGTKTSLLSYLKENNVYTQVTGQPVMIRAMNQLETASLLGNKRAVSYRRDPEVLKAHIPMPLRFMPVEIRNLTYYVNGIFRLGGLDIRLPNVMRYLDEI